MEFVCNEMIVTVGRYSTKTLYQQSHRLFRVFQFDIFTIRHFVGIESVQPIGGDGTQRRKIFWFHQMFQSTSGDGQQRWRQFVVGIDRRQDLLAKMIHSIGVQQFDAFDSQLVDIHIPFVAQFDGLVDQIESKLLIVFLSFFQQQKSFNQQQSTVKNVTIHTICPTALLITCLRKFKRFEMTDISLSLEDNGG